MDEEKGVEQWMVDTNVRFYKALESLSNEKIEEIEEVWNKSKVL